MAHGRPHDWGDICLGFVLGMIVMAFTALVMSLCFAAMNTSLK